MAFATKYSITFMDVNNVSWAVLFEEDGWGGGITTLTPGANPVNLIYNQTDKFQTIVGSSVDIQFLYESVADDLYTEASQTIRVSIERASTAYWQGFLLPGQYIRKFNQPKHFITLTAIDGLGELKNIKFESSGNPYYYQQTEMAIIAEILQKTGLQWNILEAINIYEDGYSSGVTNSPLIQTYLYPEMFWDELTDERSDCHYVLTQILKKYGATIRQQDSTWYILRPNSFMYNSIRYRLYTYLGVYSSSSLHTSYNTIGSSLFYMYADAEVTKKPGYGRSEIILDPPRRSNILKNGSFNSFTWSGGSPRYWADSGSPSYEESSNALKMGNNELSSVPTDYITATMSLYKSSGIRAYFDVTPYYTGTPLKSEIYIQFILAGKYLGTSAWFSSPAYKIITGVASGTAFRFETDFPAQSDYYFAPESSNLEVRIFEFHCETAQGTPWDQYIILNNFTIEVEFDDSDTKVYSFDNSITINNIHKDRIAIGDSWMNDEYSSSYDDTFFTNTTAVARGNQTDLWFIKGDAPTEATGVKIAELLAKQYVEGYRRSIDLFRGTIRTALTSMANRSFRDDNLTDENGFAKYFIPHGIIFNIHRSEWNGEWIEVTPTYNDELLDWASHTYATATITGNSIDIDSDPTSVPDTVTSDPYTAIVGELIRIVVTCVDDGGSDLPGWTFDGDTGALVWGDNPLSFQVTSAGAKTLVLDHGNGETAVCTLSFKLYSLTGI